MSGRYPPTDIMPERWAMALERRGQGLAFSRIGGELGVTKERAAQIVRKAERRARELANRTAAAPSDDSETRGDKVDVKHPAQLYSSV